MLDIHTHILPLIDDGAKSVEEAENMLKMLKEQGVTDVVLTPHFYLYSQDLEVFCEQRDRAFEEISRTVPKGLRLHLGAEIAFYNISIDYKALSRLSIDGGRYILLELPFSGDYGKTILPKLESFICNTGLTPIIAHAERYKAVQRHPAIIADLIDMGCMIQVDAESVLGSKPKSLVDAMLRHGQVHLIGSDCHGMSYRRPNYRPAYDFIKARYGSSAVETVDSIGKCVLNNEKITLFTDSKIKKLFGQYR